ncbi:H/ACA ribonucleoprotein complex subunit 4 [Cardamine amara subsp. amara]|uniref:tRNA pseudouridine(55) synthase n=1 Tax=Cardamine amara subsp. amara TaxID=228776 RepID=A0ABD1AHT2_CARAN
MAKSLHFTRLMSYSARISMTSSPIFFSVKQSRNIHKPYFTSLFLSTTSTPYPLQYEMIINRPTQSSLSQNRRRSPRAIESGSPDSAEPEFDSWVDNKLALEREKGRPGSGDPEMDKSKRKYYSKRRKRLYGSDSEDESRKSDDGFVELKPEVVEFNRLHQREEELYFYDTFAYPWEKDKHYKMVYQLEKKYFPDQCLNKAFLQPGESLKKADNDSGKVRGKKKVTNGGKRIEVKRIGMENCDEVDGGDDKLVFFDETKKKPVEDVVTEKKVEQFFKGLTKSTNEKGVASGGGGGDVEPFLVTRNGELPPRWDGPNGTVLLVNKPKGWTSFTVCGKLRRLVKVQKVGHAGTLDPMATGLLIVCIGKATKVVDRYQGMIKGYSGVFRLGEATSTLDADSPVIQREPWEHIKDDDIKKALTSFLGEIWQVPPMFSAIKVGGEKMYDKARRGETVELSPRRISIFQFDIERSLDDRQNLIFRVICSKGTYIRSLCADLAKALGSCAHLTALRRDSIGEYSANDAWEFNELEAAITKNYF